MQLKKFINYRVYKLQTFKIMFNSEIFRNMIFEIAQCLHIPLRNFLLFSSRIDQISGELG